MNARPRRPALALLVPALSLALAACDGAGGGGATTAAPSAAPPPSAAAGATATATAAATAKAAPADPLAGTWTGSYDAKKGEVSLPPKVKDKALASDDGKASSGPGTIEIVIGPDGAVRGKLAGALGACTLVGRAEDGKVNVSVAPDDPRAPNAMTGVLHGALAGEVIRGDLQVAGPDATVVRKSAVELKRK